MAVLAGVIAGLLAAFTVLFAVFQEEYSRHITRRAAFLHIAAAMVLLAAYELAVRHVIGAKAATLLAAGFAAGFVARNLPPGLAVAHGRRAPSNFERHISEIVFVTLQHLSNMYPEEHVQMPLDLAMMLGKLTQLEEQAELSVTEYPKGMGVERQRLVLALTKFLKAHVQGAVREQERALPEGRGAGKVSN